MLKRKKIALVICIADQDGNYLSELLFENEYLLNNSKVSKIYSSK